jgi:two-component system, OmpR family, sensor histidine kinase KdpD
MRHRPVLIDLLAAVAAVALFTALMRQLEVTNPTTVALGLLMVVLLTAALSRLRVAVATSLVAMLAFNFFFLPPIGTLTIADPQNWVALVAFLAVAVVASQLSAAVRDREREAVARRHELARLFDLSRDVLLTAESEGAIDALARHIARRFELPRVAVCLPGDSGWQVHQGGEEDLRVDDRELGLVMARAGGVLEFDARQRTYGGHANVRDESGHDIALVPLRLGTQAIGLLGAPAGSLEPGTLDALAGVAAIAVERSEFLSERKEAEMTRQRAELSSALLASLGHDLRTPLTAIRVAASNLKATALSSSDRLEQSDVILSEVERLTRLFQNILEMARIDTGTIAAESLWSHPAEIIAAAREQVEHTLRPHPIELNVEGDVLVRLDPRLTATAIAHVLENAAQYSPAGSVIQISTRVDANELIVRVRDHGPGIAPADLPHLFDRFYRGVAARNRTSGTGMGLWIARGLLAAENGRMWADNHPEGGAEFTIVIPVMAKGPEAAGSPVL